MPDLSVLALSSRTAALLLAPPGTLFDLPAPVCWTLQAEGTALAAGRATVAPLFLEGLAPDTAYRLESDLGPLAFHTPPCAGLVEAAAHGVDPAQPDNAAAFARAIAAVPPGGTLLVPAGRHVTGPIFLRPGITLYLPEGAEIAARADRSDWPVLPARDAAGRIVGTWEGLPEASHAAPVTAIGCDGLTITGRGTIDGGGDRGDWWSWPKATRNGARRPRTLFLGHSAGVTLSGFTVRNSPSWTVHPYRCDGLTAAALTIRNPPDSPNTDGFNPESCLDMTLTGLDFSVGDDCIAIKAGKRSPGDNAPLAPTRRLTIRHCRMAQGHGAVVIGSEMSGDVTDVEIARCSFAGTDRGLRIKTRRGRGGLVARIRMTDVRMTGVPAPVTANAFYFCDPDGRSDAVQSRLPAPVDATTPRIEDIALTHIVASGVQFAALALLGLPEAPIRGVAIHDMRVSFDPAAVAGVPLMACGVAAVRHIALMADHAEVSGGIFTEAGTKDLTPC